MKIFITVGNQMPFDRLLKIVDDWASDKKGYDFFAQVSHASYEPKNFKTVDYLDSNSYERRLKECDLVISHAGMGNILKALEFGKPIVVFPRKASLKETRNDHQFDTIQHLKSSKGIHAAKDETELLTILNDPSNLKCEQLISKNASELFQKHLQSFIEDSRISTDSEREFDGIVCFGGEDWWYHNRGHYDMQMMREFSKIMPVLYINSIGMRSPSVKEGRVFLKRIKRKLKSMFRGMKCVANQMYVYSPFTSPGLREKWFGKWLLALQIKFKIKKLKLKKPLIWILTPNGIEVVGFLKYQGLVYQRTDRFEAFKGVDYDKIKSYDTRLKKMADATLFCSSLLFEEEQKDCFNAQFLDHGVDYDYFLSANENKEDPQDIQNITRPRVGFIGSIDSHTFDPDMFVEIVKLCPEIFFILVGGCTLPQDWCNYENVHFTGQKEYQEVASYMSACDVLIMPWNKSDWIMACNPIKLKEYMSVGRPIVSSYFYEIKKYSEYVTVAENAKDFSEAIKKAISSDFDPNAMRNRVKTETWSCKAEQLLKILETQRLYLNSKK